MVGRVFLRKCLPFVTAVWTIAGTTAAWAQCDAQYVDVRGDWGQARFQVEIADSHSEHQRGLMHRESLPRRAGMLFYYDSVGLRNFWMKNTLIPLDILFIDADGTIVHIHPMAKPLDRTLIPSILPVKAALEINGGTAQTYGITVGSVLRHPIFDQTTSLWPCEPS